jgi:hypothetical protein
MKWLVSVIILIVGAVLVIALPYKPKTTLCWDPPTTNTDGTPLTDLVGYKAYSSQVSGTYTDAQGKDVGDVTCVNFEQTFGMQSGLYYYVITAYNTANIESQFSNEVSNLSTKQSNEPKNTRTQ